MSVSFAKPPINEVVLGQVFLPRPDLLIPHYGAFWQLVKGDYPKVSHAAMVVTPGTELVQDATGVLLPRVQFRSSDETRLVQLQQDRFYVNWRQTEKQERYPRFPSIKAEHDKVWGLFQAFVGNELGTPLQPTRRELTYTNIIPHGMGWQTASEYGNVLRDLAVLPNRYLQGLSKVALVQEFELPENSGALAVRIATGQRKDTGAWLIRLELAASGPVREAQSFEQWVDIAHETIVEGFKDVTTSLMHQTYWDLQESES